MKIFLFYFHSYSKVIANIIASYLLEPLSCLQSWVDTQIVCILC